jgi:hypothetical protein
MAEAEKKDEFWESIQREIEEEIIWFSLGENLGPMEGIEKNTVGLFFLTPTRFFFQTNPKRDFLSSIVKGFRSKSKQQEVQRLEYVVRLDCIRNVDREKRRGFLDRLTLPSLPIIRMNISEEGSKPLELRFSLLSKEKAADLFETLDRLGGLSSKRS